MNIRLLGFKWSLPGVVTQGDFFTHLKKSNRIPFDFGGYPRVCVFSVTHERLVGVLLTIRDQKKYAAMDGSFRVTIQEILKGSQMVDFNFFALHKRVENNCLHGVYSYYKSSMTLGKFNQLIIQQYDDLCCKRIEKETPNSATLSMKNAVLRKYSNSMVAELVYREDEWDVLIEDLKRLSSFRVDAAVFTNRQPFWTFSQSAINSQTMEVSFNAHADQIGLKADVKKLIKDMGIKRGTLKGKNQDDDDDTINLLKTPSGYKTYLFNDIVVEEKEGAFLNYDRVQDSPFLVTMMEEVDKILEFGA